MNKNNEHENNQLIQAVSPKPLFRSTEQLELRDRLLLGPELLKESEGSGKRNLFIPLLGGTELNVEDYVIDYPKEYDYKFYKDWYYRLADLYRADRKLMDKYVKPRFVPMFKIQFIYARFPEAILKELRRKSPLIAPGYSSLRTVKLYNHLSQTASDDLDLFIEQCYDLMQKCSSVIDFKLAYGEMYHVNFQVNLFPEEY